jgi:hypothetical protein
MKYTSKCSPAVSSSSVVHRGVIQKYTLEILAVLDFVHLLGINISTRHSGNWFCFRVQVKEDAYSVESLRKS